MPLQAVDFANFFAGVPHNEDPISLPPRPRKTQFFPLSIVKLLDFDVETVI